MNTNLKISNITKIYPGCVANDNVSLEFDSGKIYALLGENLVLGKSQEEEVLIEALASDLVRLMLRQISSQ